MDSRQGVLKHRSMKIPPMLATQGSVSGKAGSCDFPFDDLGEPLDTWSRGGLYPPVPEHVNAITVTSCGMEVVIAHPFPSFRHAES